MSYRRTVGWPLVLTSVGIAALVASIGRVSWLYFLERDRTAADAESSVFNYFVAAFGAVLVLLGRFVQQRRAARLPPAADQLDCAAATLAGRVAQQWSDEARLRFLDDPAPIPVRWRFTDSTHVTDSGRAPVLAAGPIRIEALAAAFRALPRRRLIIAGGAGTGKTTLALQLLRELLARPEPGEAVPVLLSLAEWDVDAQPQIREWLAAQLERVCPELTAIAPAAARTLAERERILPVLDGLDEVLPDRRATIIDALNKQLSGGFVLTTRWPEYQEAVAAGHLATAAAVIRPFLLTRQDAAGYLRTVLPGGPPRWDDVLHRLASGTAHALAAVTETPLGLWLVRAAYVDTRRDPTPLVDGTYADAAALRAHLLDELVPALVAVRQPRSRAERSASSPLRPKRRHDPADLTRWLSTVADDLRDAGTRDWRWWELARTAFPTERSRRRTRSVVMFVVGLLCGLIGMLFGVLFAEPVDVPVASIGLGVLLAFGGWSSAGFAIDLRAPPRHGDARLAGRVSELLAALMFGVGFGLVLSAVTSGVVLLLPVDADTTTAIIAIVVVIGVCVGLSRGLSQFLRSNLRATRAVSPLSSYRGDRTLALAEASCDGVLCGLPLGVISTALKGPVLGAAAWAAAILMIALCSGFKDSAWFAFVLAALRYRRRSRLPAPWRVLPTLDDCHRLGLLRAVGPVYQFRHAALQDHLAPPCAPDLSPLSAPASSRSS